MVLEIHVVFNKTCTHLVSITKVLIKTLSFLIVCF